MLVFNLIKLWTNLSKWHGSANLHWLWKRDTGPHATWILSPCTLPPGTGTLISKLNKTFYFHLWTVAFGTVSTYSPSHDVFCFLFFLPLNFPLKSMYRTLFEQTTSLAMAIWHFSCLCRDYCKVSTLKHYHVHNNISMLFFSVVLCNILGGRALRFSCTKYTICCHNPKYECHLFFIWTTEKKIFSIIF